MMTLLRRIWGLAPPSDDPEVRRSYGFMCAGLGIALNILLFAGKFFAGLLSGSIAITADAFNNLSDAGSSVVTLMGFKLASQRPDRNHPFGHGRFEYVSGFVVAMLILLMAFELGKGAIAKILAPAPMEAGLLPALILAASIAVKLYMALYNRRIGRIIGSPAMMATATDSLADAASTAAVLLSMGLHHFWHINLDGWFGLLVAAFIGYTGISAAWSTLSPLLGQAPDPALVRNIREAVLAYPGVIGVHDLIIHDYGPGRIMISLHAEVPSDGNILALHDTIDTIERHLQQAFNCHAVIHMDPLDTDDVVLSGLREQVDALVRAIDTRLHIHDFRMVSGVTHSNLIFDVVAPYDIALSNARLQDTLAEAVTAGLEGTYYTVITIDRDYG